MKQLSDRVTLAAAAAACFTHFRNGHPPKVRRAAAIGQNRTSQSESRHQQTIEQAGVLPSAASVPDLDAAESRLHPKPT